MSTIAEQYMSMALSLAEKGLGKTWPNPMVGAVIVKKNKLIGQGWHQRYGADHAEIMALQQAGQRAKGAALYVSLEPCCHTGLTPPCTQAIIKAGIKTVVAAMRDPNPKVSGKGFRQLKRANIEVIQGIKAKEAKALNRVWIKKIRTNYPYVISKAALTLDGKIADDEGNSKWITSTAARKKAHQLRRLCQAIIVGGGTAIKDDPLLTARLARSPKKQPVRVVVEGRRTLPLSCRLITSSGQSPVIIATAKKKEKHPLRQCPGVTIWSLPSTHGRIDIVSLLQQLAQQNIMLVMLEGGSELQASFLGTTKDQQSNLVDEVFWLFAPKIIGGKKALSVVGGNHGRSINQVIDINQASIKPVGRDWLLQGTLSG